MIAQPVCLIARITPEFISRPSVLWRFMENDRLKLQLGIKEAGSFLMPLNLQNDLLPAVN